MEITFVRHAESTSNVAGRWQGHGDAPLSGRGREQARALAERLASRSFDLVLSSDLSRAADTARALERPVETDPEWREVDVGGWEGLTRERVAELFPDQIAALQRGESIPIGGGESWQQLHARIDAALDRLRSRLDDDARALVVSHGGVIHGLVAGLMGLRDQRPRPIGRLANASLTTLRWSADEPELVVYNDASHLDPLGRWARERHEAGDTVVTLVGHDASRSDGASTLSGGRLRTDGPLLEVERLGNWYEGPSHTYASGTGGLRDAAAVLAERLGARMQQPRTPDKGAVGTIEDLAARHRGERIAVVMESSAIADYATSLFGHHPVTGPRIGAPWHTGVSHVVVTPRGHTFADYNLGPHLAG